jgi:general secretion pathway protein L
LKETLFIRLPVEGAQANWCLRAEPGGFSTVQSGSLDDAVALGASRRVVVIAPAADISMTTAEMPARLAAGQSSKIQQAVPYILEERLAEDVETLHFAIGRRLADGTIPVAIVSREQMAAWMAPFRSRGISPALLVSDIQCLPMQSGASPVWSVLLEGSRATVRSGQHAGFTCEAEMLGEFLSLARAPAELRLRVYPTADAAPMPSVTAPVDLASPVANGFEYLLRGLDEVGVINLLQGEYATQTDYRRWVQPWRAALIMFGIWLLLGLASQLLEYRQLKQQQARQQQAAESAFRAAFPQITHIVDLQAQARQQLAILQKAGGGAGFLSLLQGTTAVLNKNPALKLQEIQFHEGALSLGLEASDIQALDAFQQSFAAQPGLVLEVQSANAGASGVQIRARVKAHA